MFIIRTKSMAKKPRSISRLFVLAMFPLSSYTSLAAADGLLVLRENCFRCHGEENRKGGLVLTSRKAALRGGESGKVIDLEKPENSFLLEVLAENGDPHMPPKKQLTEKEIAAVKKWLRAGAKWDPEVLAELPARKVKTWRTLPPGSKAVRVLAASPDGSRLATARGKAVETYVLSEKDANRTDVWSGDRDEVRSLAWSGDGKWLAAGGFQRVVLFNAAGDSLVQTRLLEEGLSGRVTALAFAGEKDEWLVAADGEPTVAGRLVVFETKTGKRLKTLRAHGDTVFDLALSPDGKLIASAGADKLAKLWEVGSWKSAGTLEGHTGYVLAAAFSPEGERIATVSADATVKAWRVKTLKEFSQFSGRGAKLPKTDVLWLLDPTKEKPTDKDDWLLTVSEDGVPRAFTKLVEHEGAQTSAGATERAWSGSGPEAEHTAAAYSAHTKQIITADVQGALAFHSTTGKLLRVKEPPTDENQTVPAKLVSFRNDVLPILTRAGCASGSCHAKQGGQNGFQLSIFSYDNLADHRALTRSAWSRRILPTAPEQSLLLRKATAAIDHDGDKRFSTDSPFYETLRDWIAQGAPYSSGLKEPVLKGIAVSPHSGRYVKGQNVSLKVTARYSDGSERNVTHLAEYQAEDEAMLAIDEDGRATLGGQAGEAVAIVRYLDQVAVARLTVPVEKLLPTDAYASLPVQNEIDRLAYARHKRMGLLVSERCSDSTFLRRASLDLLGKLPGPERARAFLDDDSPDKRNRLVERLLADPAWADHWAVKFGDLLRPNVKRVGVKPVLLLDDWLRRRLRANVSYAALVRELLTAQGSSHAYGPIAIWRHKREPAEMGAYVSRIFLGVRLECAQCHHHPSEKWGQDDYYRMAAFFGSMKRKGQGISAPISGEPEYWWFQPGGSVKHPVTGQNMTPKPPDAPPPDVPAEQDPRRHLLDWMLAPENPYFAQAVVNRVWAEFFGIGIVHPVDDFRDSNPPTNGPLLDWLAKDFADHDHDLKHLMGRILRSRLYQTSSLPNETNAADHRNFSRALRRRLPAEVMADAVAQFIDIAEDYPGLPARSTAKQVWNTDMDSTFLDTFGRPDESAEAPCERDPSPTITQTLHLLNNVRIVDRIALPAGRAGRLAKSDLSPEGIVEILYLAAYARLPREKEREIALAAFQAEETSRKIATEDLIWALLNTAEFVLNH